jgi:hypothetical protein
VGNCQQVIAETRKQEEWISEPRHDSENWVCWGMVHLAKLDAAILEPCFLKLPLKMIPAVFDYMS